MIHEFASSRRESKPMLPSGIREILLTQLDNIMLHDFDEHSMGPVSVTTYERLEQLLQTLGPEIHSREEDVIFIIGRRVSREIEDWEEKYSWGFDGKVSDDQISRLACLLRLRDRYSSGF